MAIFAYILLSVIGCKISASVGDVECSSTCETDQQACYEECDTECVNADGDTDQTCDTDCHTVCDDTYTNCGVDCTTEA